MPFLKALLFLWCFLPLRFRDIRRMSRRARRRASSSDGGSPSTGGFGIGGPPPRVSLTASSLTALRASFTFLGDLSFLWSLNSFLATCSASFLSRMTCVIVALDAVAGGRRVARGALGDAKAGVSVRRGAPRRRRQGRLRVGKSASLGCPTPAGAWNSPTKLPSGSL